LETLDRLLIERCDLARLGFLEQRLSKRLSLGVTPLMVTAMMVPRAWLSSR